ncbi:hypothetical protein KGM_213189 [Danaus plexippus plexippus]|uniref:Uncharacterized protein n=1 Tax=Danaus plexippus plexippus TaxID=278856 RepID=A0A212FAU2_DANPL|nr:hypothetical protein KGM_213189 [Danaus plexippus plexippus]
MKRISQKRTLIKHITTYTNLHTNDNYIVAFKLTLTRLINELAFTVTRISSVTVRRPLLQTHSHSDLNVSGAKDSTQRSERVEWSSPTSSARKVCSEYFKVK